MSLAWAKEFLCLVDGRTLAVARVEEDPAATVADDGFVDDREGTVEDPYVELLWWRCRGGDGGGARGGVFKLVHNAGYLLLHAIVDDRVVR